MATPRPSRSAKLASTSALARRRLVIAIVVDAARRLPRRCRPYSPRERVLANFAAAAKFSTSVWRRAAVRFAAPSTRDHSRLVNVSLHGVESSAGVEARPAMIVRDVEFQRE